jgi:O-methyltransferase
MNLLTLKARIGAAMARMGYGVYRLEEDGEIIRSMSNFTPWRSDEPFDRALQSVRQATLVDKFRMYELWQLVEQSKKLEGDILEVGVWRGGSSALMGVRARDLGIDCDLFACDSFRGVVKTGPHDPLYEGGEHADTSREKVDALFSSLGLPRVRVLEGIFPDDTAAAIADRRFRLCHIDVDAYQSAKDVHDWVWPRLVAGGIIIYDDYGFRSTLGVTKYVDEQRPLEDRIVIHNLNGHAVVIKLR